MDAQVEPREAAGGDPAPRPRPAPAGVARPMAMPSAGPSPFVPVLLLALAFVGWLAFQTFHHLGDRRQLAALHGGIEAQEASARKVRTALDSVATSTAALAEGGNPNARLLVEQLRQRGVTINAAGASKPPP